MQKPTRRYLEYVRGLQETLQRQLEQVTRPIRTKAGIQRVPFTDDQRDHQEQLLKLCEQEIKRVEKAVGRRRAD